MCSLFLYSTHVYLFQLDPSVIKYHYLNFQLLVKRLRYVNGYVTTTNAIKIFVIIHTHNILFLLCVCITFQVYSNNMKSLLLPTQFKYQWLDNTHSKNKNIWTEINETKKIKNKTYLKISMHTKCHYFVRKCVHILLLYDQNTF